MTLDDVEPGQVCRIIDLKLEGPELQRMMDLGMIEGEAITMVRNAPLLDPLNINVKESLVALRRQEAKGIEVELV